jgi:hypothetical protein
MRSPRNFPKPFTSTRQLYQRFYFLRPTICRQAQLPADSSFTAYINGNYVGNNFALSCNKK